MQDSQDQELKSQPSLAAMISGLGGGEIDLEEFDEEEGLGSLMRTIVTAAGEMRNKMDEQRVEDEEIMKAQFEDDPGEDELLSPNKPFKGALKEPIYRLPHNSSKPDEQYSLHYVYGYRCADSRQNVKYTCEGKVVYMTAAVGVVLNQETNTQQFFGGKAVTAGMHSGKKYHNDDILCLTISRDRTLVATGQVGSKPVLIVWDCQTFNSVIRHQLPKGSRGISTIALNPSCTRVACSDESDAHVVRVIDIKTNKLIFQSPSGSSKLYDMSFSPAADVFAISGLKTIKFYFGDKNDVYKVNNGILGPAMKELSAFSAVCFTSKGDALVTTAKGSLLQFKDRSCVKFSKLHKGAIFSCTVDEAGIVFTGGRDGFVRSSDGRQWQFKSPVRAIDSFQGKLVVGLRNGSIIEVGDSGMKEIMSSHCDGELWGLEYIGDGKCITSADDNCVMLWDIDKRRRIGVASVNKKPGPKRKAGAGASTLSLLPPNQQSRAVAYCAQNQHVAVSDNEGNVSIRASPAQLQKIFLPSLKPAPKEWNQAMRYSPDGSYLAVGSHDNFIYIYSVAEYYGLYCRLAAHNSFIVNFDWSLDGKYIRSNCGAYQYLFFDVQNKGAHIPDGASVTADVKWATHTCVLSWETEQVSPPYTDGTHVNTVALSNSGTFFASGDDWGLLCLHRNPIRNMKHKCHCYRAHSEHVVRVVFAGKNDEFILSAGGYDQTLMQWKKVE